MALIGVGALGAGLSGWLLRRASWAERFLLIAGGLILVYPSTLSDILGIALVALVAIWQWFKNRGERMG